MQVELKPWVDENFTIFASAVGNTPLNRCSHGRSQLLRVSARLAPPVTLCCSIVLHCMVDKKKEIFGGALTNKKRRWLVRLQSFSDAPSIATAAAAAVSSTFINTFTRITGPVRRLARVVSSRRGCKVRGPETKPFSMTHYTASGFHFFLHIFALTDACVRFAAFGFSEGRNKAKPNGKIEFAGQDVMTVTFLSCSRVLEYFYCHSVQQLKS